MKLKIHTSPYSSPYKGEEIKLNMHTTNLDISLEEITKIEGTAELKLKIREGVVTECKFGITEMKRFFTSAIKGKPVVAVPQLVARICGTCSNAHLLCSIASLENGLAVTSSPQTILLRKLLNYGLIIRDHGLHLYVFVLPDLYQKNSILEFDEHDEAQHQLLHDCFDVKEAGNKLGIATGGRSVHAPLATIGGFTKLPTKEELTNLIPQLTKIRPRILALIDIFLHYPATQAVPFKFLALADPEYSFLSGAIKTSDAGSFPLQEFAWKLKRVAIPYSQATGYYFGDSIHMVGALARMNLNKQALHTKTRKDAAGALAVFPSTNIYHNNLAQAIEMLHAVDSSIDLINEYQALAEKPAAYTPHAGTGIGLIEAPRGTLFHKMDIGADGKITGGKIIVPTGQNQIGIEQVIRDYVSTHIDDSKESLTREIEQLIRAYDPCMSCATHFLKIKWK